jgi:dTMP kinase
MSRMAGPHAPAQPGIFITLEGGEGVGKSTQIKALRDLLATSGREIILTREPGGTPGAEALRGLLLNPASAFTPLADLFLHFAARADHVERLIKPALARGAIVLCDRFYDSTMAYQGYGMGVDRDDILRLIRMLGCYPTLTFVLHAPPDVTAARLAARGGGADRYERMDHAMQARIAAGFRAIAADEAVRCALIDASGPAAAVTASIAAILHDRLGIPRAAHP